MANCKTCELLKSGKNILYEDEVVVVIAPEKGCTKGHLKVIPKKHVKSIEEVSSKDAEHLFYTASYSATALFENLGAQGTNIICNSGEGEHLEMHVISRMENDGLNFMWEPKQAEESDLKDALDRIKDKTDLIGVEKPKKKIPQLDSSAEEISSEVKKTSGDDSDSDDGEVEENYLTKQLKRMP